MRRLTTQEFIEKAQKIHGDKYDYSKVEYINGKTKVCIICPEHGEFWMRPNDILNGTSCPSCCRTKKMTTIDFVTKSKIVHNNFFSYEKTEYINSNSKVIVTCPIHGDFEVKANNHLNCANFKKCQHEGISHEITILKKHKNSTKKLTNEEFLKKCFEKWGNKYTYEKTEYIASRKKVIITCPIHGDFEITPNHFLNGRGCAYCAKNGIIDNGKFIEKAKKIHGDKYDYSKIQYMSTHKQICIICPDHGEFWQTPANHLKGEGCPLCKQSKLENTIHLFLKENHLNFIPQKKFKWLGRQSLDFYLPDYNIAIECQGIQHFETVPFFKNNNIFRLDNKKQKLCEKHGVKILYYSELNVDYPYEVITNKEKLLEIIQILPIFALESDVSGF